MTDFSEEELKEILWEEDEGFTAVTTETLEDTSRWRTFYSQVFKETATGKLYQISWNRGSTEYQDDGVEDLSCVEVFPYEKVVIEYRPVQKALTQ